MYRADADEMRTSYIAEIAHLTGLHQASQLTDDGKHFIAFADWPLDPLTTILDAFQT